MKYEELSENMQKQIDELKHYAQTIQSDLLDALKSAESIEAFRSQIESSMERIMKQKVREVLGTGKRSVVHVKKDYPPILKGSAKSFGMIIKG